MKIFRRASYAAAVAVLTLAIGLFAAACAKKVTLTFETNGGSPVSDVTAEAGAELTLPQTLKSGYAFDGWYSSPDFTGDGLRGEISAPGEDTKYYAKWSKAYAVRLETDGGVFEAGAPELWLAEGANVYEAVKDLRPTKSGLDFGAWFAGDAEIANGYRMPAGELTLTAKYKVGYTVETYLHNLAGNSYVRGESATGTDYVGANVTPAAPTLTGFTRTDTPSGETPVSSLVLKENAEENLFKFYYDRLSYSVVYLSNLPEEIVSGSMSAEQYVYGGEAPVRENGFTANGYRFLGWGTSPADGEPVYRAGDALEVEGDIVLYAIWQRGYLDRFGSNDVIYFPQEEPEKAVLERGGCDFEGTRQGNSFRFELGGGKELTGTVFGAMFSYARTELAGEYALYDGYAKPEYRSAFDEARFNDSVTLTIDEYLNAVYRKNGHSCEGVVEYDERNGDYLFTSEDESFNCLFSETDLPAYPRVFSIGGDEADVYLDWWFIGDTGLGFSNGDILILDGYGTAVLQYSANGFPLQFTGSYYIMGEYVSGGYPMKKIYCDVYDGMGILGNTEGYYGNYIYTFPLSEMTQGVADYSGYVIAEETHRGEFRSADGATLVLDGFGIFPDSAVYTAPDGSVYQSSYVVESDYTSGRVVRTEHDGTTDLFQIGSGASFVKLETETAKKYREYRLVNSMLDFPLAVVYEEKEGDGFKTELYMTENDGQTVILAASGYCTEQSLGGDYKLYSFTRTALHNNYLPIELPETMQFYTTEVISSEALDEVAVYCVTKYNGEAYYREIEVEGLGTLWANDYVTLAGLGSLLFRGDGSVVEGSFTETQNRYFSGAYGSFLYGDGINNYNVRFNITAGEGEDEWLGTIIEDVETELYFYYFDPVANQGSYVVDLVLGTDGAASWNDDHSYGKWQIGSYAATGTTVFGDAIYTLTIGGEKKFEFILYDYVNPDGSVTPIYFLHEPAYEGTYTARDGSVLVLDGFYCASYSANGATQRGTYDVDGDGFAVYFTPDGGEGRFFEFVGETSFVALDAAYGEWYLVNSSYVIINNSTIFFDGKGKATIYSAGGNTRSGFYTVETSGESVECRVTANLGGKYGMGEYLVKLEYYANSGMYACIVYDKSTTGVFVDENWNVLRLDGYGNGALYTADRGMVGSGYYYVVDEEKNFIEFTFDSASAVYGSDVYIVLDEKNNAFVLQDYSDYGLVYLSSQMDYIVFGTDGIINVGRRSGYYLVEETGISAYLYNYDSDSFTKTTMPLLSGGGKYSYENADYYLWDGKAIVVDGSIRLLDKQGEVMKDRQPLSAKIEFSPTLGSNVNLDATFTIDGETYGGFSLNLYTNGRLDPRVTYDSVDYKLSFSYDPEGESSFLLSAGYTAMTYQDYLVNYYEAADSHRGGKIVKEWIGFGPKVLEQATYSGAFYYLYQRDSFSEPIVFENVKQDQVIVNGYRAQLGDEFEIVFRFKEETYAIDFFLYDVYYSLYSFYRYEEVTANDGYKVGVKYLLYNNVANTPGYGRLAEDAGKPLGATLFGQDGKAVVTYDTNITVATQDVWLVEYDREKNTVGKGYYIDFTVEGGKATAAQVTSYKFWQILTSARDYMADVFLDEKGDVAKLLSVAYLDYSGSFAWIDGTSDLQHEEGSEIWTFRGCMGGEPVPVTMQFLRGEDNPETRNPTYVLKVIV